MAEPDGRRGPQPPRRRDRSLVLHDVPLGPASTTGCQSSQQLDKLRRGSYINPSLERALALHLSRPCLRCLARLATLRQLSGDDDSPVVDLAPTESPVVRALRTLAGWPPRRWLRVERRRAAERVDEPLGFLALVLEEAHHLVEPGSGGVLRRWVDIILGVAQRAGVWRVGEGPSRVVMARAFLYLARVEQRQGHWPTALDWLDRGARLADVYREDPFLAAQTGETYGRLIETRDPGFAGEQYRRAAGWLAPPLAEPESAAARRAEILLAQARGRLAGVAPETAPDLVRRARRTLGDVGAPLVERSLHQARALIAVGEARTAGVGVPRMLAAARLAVHLAASGPTPKLVDPDLSEEYGRLRGHLDELWERHRPHWIEREVLPDLEGEDEARVRVVLAAWPGETAEQHFERLVELAANPAIATDLEAQHREVRRWRKALSPSVRGFPELLAPLDEIFSRLGRPSRKTDTTSARED